MGKDKGPAQGCDEEKEDEEERAGTRRRRLEAGVLEHGVDLDAPKSLNLNHAEIGLDWQSTRIFTSTSVSSMDSAEYGLRSTLYSWGDPRGNRMDECSLPNARMDMTSTDSASFRPRGTRGETHQGQQDQHRPLPKLLCRVNWERDITKTSGEPTQSGSRGAPQQHACVYGVIVCAKYLVCCAL